MLSERTQLRGNRIIPGFDSNVSNLVPILIQGVPTEIPLKKMTVTFNTWHMKDTSRSISYHRKRTRISFTLKNGPLPYVRARRILEPWISTNERHWRGFPSYAKNRFVYDELPDLTCLNRNLLQYGLARDGLITSLLYSTNEMILWKKLQIGYKSERLSWWMMNLTPTDHCPYHALDWQTQTRGDREIDRLYYYIDSNFRPCDERY